MLDRLILPIHIPIYGKKLVFIYGDDFKWFKKKFKKDLHTKNVKKELKSYLNLFKQLQEDPSNGSYCVHDGLKVIHVKEINDLPRLMSVVSHVLFHCIADIMDEVGVKLSDESEEAYAYLQGYLVQEIIEKLKT